MPPNHVSCALFAFQVELETARQQISLLNQQKELLRERLESVSDYPSVRKEKTELQGQLRLLKAQLEEARDENRILQAGEALMRSQSTSQEEVWENCSVLASFP